MKRTRLEFMMRDPRRWAALLAVAAPLAAIAVMLLPVSPDRSEAGAPRMVEVSPSSGLPGQNVTVSGSGGWLYNVNPPYQIFWDEKGGDVIGTFAPSVSGTWSEQVTIPMSAGTGAHQIVACEGAGGDFQACESVNFTVLATPTPPPPRTISLDPPSGLAGAAVKVSGSGGWIYNVNPPYYIYWDEKGGDLLDDFAPGVDGSWNETVAVPGNASPGAYQIVACEGAGGDFQACASETFTVLAAATDTPTPEDTPVPTNTPVAPTNTPTSPPPTATHTPEPGGLVGDADCNGVVNAIDAAFILQFAAALLSELPCPDNADVNGDGNHTAVDAALILQFSAGLLGSLPP